MMDIEFLAFDDIVRIYQDQMQRYGGKMGIRDLNALLSAIAMPQVTFEGKYLHGYFRDGRRLPLPHCAESSFH